MNLKYRSPQEEVAAQWGDDTVRLSLDSVFDLDEKCLRRYEGLFIEQERTASLE